VKTNKRISSLKSDLLPYLIQRQFQSFDYLKEKIPAIEFRKRPLNNVESWRTMDRKGFLETASQSNLEASVDSSHQPVNRVTSLAEQQTVLDYQDLDSNDALRCFGLVYEAPPSGTSIILNRVNTISTYLSLNK
jgi:hypothetical protein